MSELEKLLRQTARQLLEEGKVERIIGYERGTLPLRSTPCFVSDPADVERLIWDVTCGNNLATYLDRNSGKVGVIAKGCDSRALVNKVVEQQVIRENVTVIGVPCTGVIDPHKVKDRLDGRDLAEGEVTGDQVTIRAHNFEETLAVADLLSNDCLTCSHRTPALADILLGEADPASDDDEYADVALLEAKSPEERWAYFSQEFGRCIRCYACREACPSCYCPECFVDQSQPSWFGKSDELSDVIAFHLVRAYHVAGRCLDCGACARACPMGIDLRTLQKKLQKDIQEMFGFEAGMDLEDPPALGTFRTDDPQEFIK